MKTLDSIDENSNVPKIVVNRICGNVGYREIRDRLTAKMNKLSRTVLLALLLVVAYSLYAINHIIHLPARNTLVVVVL